MDAATMISALGDYGFEDTSSNAKVRAIQGAVRDIEAAQPWPFLETSATLNFNGSSGTATDLPARIRSVLRAKDMTNRIPLKPIRLDDLEDVIGTDYSLVADPRYYYFEGENLKFWPVPPSGRQVFLRYLQFSADINSGSAESAFLIPPRHHEAILYGALLRLMDMEDDPELAVRFESHFQNRLLTMAEDLIKKQYDEPDVIRILDPTDWDLDL